MKKTQQQQQQQIPSANQIFKKKSKNSQLYVISEEIQETKLLQNDIKKQEDEKYQKLKRSDAVSRLSIGLEIQSQSEQDLISHEQKQIEGNQQKIIKQQAEKKMVVGTGFSFDLTQFFKFQKKKVIQGQTTDTLFQYITGGYLPWVILIYSVCNSAVIPPWIMSIKANKILRISWRFLLQAVVMIPFVLYQKRSKNQAVSSKYKLQNIINYQGFRRIYISSLGTSIWFTIILSCFQWTYISHSLVFGSLSNFFLSLSRWFKGSTHQFESGGQIFVVVGILFALTDSFTLNPLEATHEAKTTINTFYLGREPIQRMIGDLFALSGAFVMAKFSQITADIKPYYPPFMSMFMVNFLNSFHIALAAYYVNGASFDLDTNFGVFGLFTHHFSGFFYMSIILSFGMFLSMTLISKLFSDPIIPALAMTLQPIFATFLLNVAQVQVMPGSYSIFGYLLIVPGLFLILIGQCLNQRAKQLQAQKQKEKNQKQMEINKQKEGTAKVLKMKKKPNQIKKQQTLRVIIKTTS